MPSRNSLPGLFDRLHREPLKFAVLAAAATATVPVFYVAAAILSTLGTATALDTTTRVAVAALAPSALAYAASRRLGSTRAAGWTAGVVLVAGLLVARQTALAFGV